jgi:hypothetical protein
LCDKEIPRLPEPATDLRLLTAAARTVGWRLRQYESPQDAFRRDTELAALTHGHPTGALTGGVLAVLVLALTDGASLREALAAAKLMLRAEPRHEETLRAIEMAEELADSGLPHEEAIARLGQGWIAEEALAISIYCALVARNFKQGVILAVNHDGDSDSTGAIVGNLLGAMHGVKAIPAEWLEPLELRDVITELAEDLLVGFDVDLPVEHPAAELQELGPDPLAAPAFQGGFADTPAGGQLLLIEVSDFHLGLLPNELAGVHEGAVPPMSQGAVRPGGVMGVNGCLFGCLPGKAITFRILRLFVYFGYTSSHDAV